ncbi:MAG: superinfection immunity protein, partial [Alphaproteobacteria bacterium]|nr:superinfection immunity protein [Alphaproteobacteria bacterium]
MSFRLRLVLGILFLVVLALVWAVNEGAPVEIIFILPVLVMSYLLPTFLALGRRHKALPAIFALNLFLGWSLLGWVAALVWSLTNPKPSEPVVINQAAGSMADELAKLADLCWRSYADCPAPAGRRRAGASLPQHMRLWPAVCG